MVKLTGLYFMFSCYFHFLGAVWAGFALFNQAYLTQYQDGRMDDMRFYVLFNSISVRLGRFEVDIERLCAMELRLRLRKFRLERGSNSVRQISRPALNLLSCRGYPNIKNVNGKRYCSMFKSLRYSRTSVGRTLMARIPLLFLALV